MPPAQPVDLHRKQLHLVPVFYFVNAIVQVRSQRAQSLAELLDSGLPDAGKGAFGDDQSGLEVLAAIDQDKHLAEIDVAEELFGVGALAADAEPQDIDRNAELVDGQLSRLPGRRMPSIAANYQISGNPDGTVGSVGLYSGNGATFLNEVDCFVLHKEIEAGESARFA